MPAQIFGTAAVVTILNRAFNDQSPSNATFNNQVAAAGNTRDANLAFAKTFGSSFAGLTADAASTKLMTNLGLLPNAGLQTALKDYITSVGVSEIGVVALQLGEILSGLENATGEQAAFKAAALAWNDEVTAAYNYSASTSSTTPSTPGGSANTGLSFTLTATADTADTVGSAVAGGAFSTAGFKFSTNNETVNATSVSLTNADNLTDGSTTDADVLALSVGTAVNVAVGSVTNIETIKIATAFSGAAAGFDATGVSGAKAVTISGTGSNAGAATQFSLTNVTSGTGITSVDASGVTSATLGVVADLSGVSAATTLKGGAGADILSAGKGGGSLMGGAGNDQLVGNIGADVITGGAGADVITLGGGINTVIFGNNDSFATSVNTIDKITGFVSGVDKLQFSVAPAAAVNFTSLGNAALAGTAASDFTDALALAQGNINANGAAQFIVQGDSSAVGGAIGSYLFADFDGNGTIDAGVFLVGVAAAGIVRTDITATPAA